MDERTIGILGGGYVKSTIHMSPIPCAYLNNLLTDNRQLGRMLVEAANNRNISIAILDKQNSPASQISCSTGVDGSFSDPQAIRKLAEQCDVLTVEIEHVDTYVLEELNREAATRGKSLVIQPSWQTIRTIQDKYLQKETLIKGKVDVAESLPISTPSEGELHEAAENLGLPFMLKARTGAYDGCVILICSGYREATVANSSIPTAEETIPLGPNMTLRRPSNI